LEYDLCYPILTADKLCIQFSMTNAEIRRRILQMLYDRFKEHPYNRIASKEFKEELNISLKDLQFHVIYLEEKKLLELQKPLEGSLFVGARITPKGIDLIEDEFQMNISFPAQPKETLIFTDVFNELQHLIEETGRSHDLGPDMRELIVEELIEIQKQLKAGEPSYTEVKKLTERIRDHDSDIWHKLLAIIKRPAVARVLSNSAKKELGI
jgi:hypothetical protein